MPRLSVFTLMLLLATTAWTQSNQPSAFDLLRPGEDGNLDWIKFAALQQKALDEKKPVLLYFYEGEKTAENAQQMIRAQTQAFPDEDVKKIAGEFLCAKIDRQKPETAGRARRKPTERRKRRKDKEEDQGEDAAEDKGDKDDKPAADSMGHILPTDKWPTRVAIVLLDYQGRMLDKPLTKIPSSGKKLSRTLQAAFVNNLKRIKADEKAAERAAKAAEKAREREAKKRAREEKQKEEDEADEAKDSDEKK